MEHSAIREAVGVFQDMQSLRRAADELMLAGFDRAQLSMLGSRKEVVEKLGRMYAETTELIDDPRVPMRNYVGTDSLTEAKAALIGVPFFIGAVAAAGPAVAANISALGLTLWVAGSALLGGLLGLIAVKVIEARHGAYLRDQLSRGGILLWVRTLNPDQEAKACEILKRTTGRDVRARDLRRVEELDPVYGYLDWLAGTPKPSRHRAAQVC